MSKGGCTAPLLRWNKTGKIISIKEAYKKGMKNEGLKKILENEEACIIPCGKCIACRLAYSRNWANRCMMEYATQKSGYFITLTYNDECVPVHNIDSNTFYKGLLYPDEYELVQRPEEILTLWPKDLQDFFKRLSITAKRENKIYEKECDTEVYIDGKLERTELGIGGLRYYACGEYGETTARPHYHAIIYNLDLEAGLNKNENDLKFKFCKKGQYYYECPWIEKIWGNGQVIVTNVTWDTCAYVARYITKKLKGKEAKEIYNKLGIEPEFVRMSLKPGIGARYYSLDKDRIYENDQIYLPKAGKVKPPRYYDAMFDLENGGQKGVSEDKYTINRETGEILDIEQARPKIESEIMKAIKRKRRKIANEKLFSELKNTTQNYIDYLRIKEEAQKETIKKLPRPEI